MATLMEITLFTEYLQQQCVNRWNYVANGTPAAVTYSFALATIMGFLPASTTLAEGTVGGEIQQLVNEQVIFGSVLARAVYIDDDFYDSPFLANTRGSGSLAAQGASPLIAFGYRSNRVKQSIGRGYKRFVGVGEDQMSTGGEFPAGVLAAMDNVAQLMGDTLTYTDEGNSLTFIPCVVQKEKYTAPSGKSAYKYYDSEATQLIHTAQGVIWESYKDVRSQVSRQYKRGK